MIIFFIVLLSFLGSKILEYFKIPKVLAPILVGIYFGFKREILSQNFELLGLLSELGAILLLFHIGLELDLRNFKKLEKETFQTAFLGVLFSLVLGFIFSFYILNLSFVVSFVIGASLCVTAEVMMSMILDEEHLLRRKIGKIILGSEIISDLVGILLLAFISILIGTKSFQIENATFLFFGLIFIAIILILFDKIANFLGRLFFREKRDSESDEFTLAIIVVIGISGFFYFLGFNYSIGAILAGILVNYSLIKFGKKGIREEHSIQKIVKAISFGFLSYFFFFWIGLQLDVSLILENPWLGFAFAVIGFIGKLFAGLFGAYINKDKLRNGVLIGLSLSTKGIMGLIIAQVALSAGLIDSQIFNAIVFMSIVLTIIPPIIFNWIVRKEIKI